MDVVGGDGADAMGEYYYGAITFINIYYLWLHYDTTGIRMQAKNDKAHS